MLVLASALLFFGADALCSEGLINPPWMTVTLPDKGFLWMNGEEFHGPCETVSFHGWMRSQAETFALFVHAEGPSGSGRYWTVTVGLGNRNDSMPFHGFCFTTSTVGWRTLRQYKRLPLPWMNDLDGNGRPELIVWSSFALTQEANYAEYGLMAWVYQVTTAGKIALDWRLTCKMAQNLATAYRSSSGRSARAQRKLRLKIAETLESVARK